MKNSYLIEIEHVFDLDECGEYNTYLVNGLAGLSKLLNMLSKSKKHIVRAINNIGQIKNGQKLLDDLSEEQKPDGMDYGMNLN